GSIDDFAQIDRRQSVFFPARLRFGIEQNLIHHRGKPSRLLFNHRGVLLDSVFIADDTVTQVMRRRANHSQWGPQLVGYTCGEFHLKPPEGSGPLAGDDDGNETRSEYQQYSKADDHVALADLLHSPLQRSQTVFHHKKPPLAGDTALGK